MSEELNIIEWDKRNEARERKSQVQRLREELAAKDLEVQSMRGEHDLASQIGGESGASFSTNETLSTKVQELEQEIRGLKAELQRQESDTTDEVDWTLAARDPYDHDDDDIVATNYDDDFTMNDEIMTTPATLNTSFPSPPSTLPNTPCRPTSSISIGIQTSLPVPDPKNEHLKSQLEALQTEVSKLNAAIAFNNDREDRLKAKLTDFTSCSFSSSSYDQNQEHNTLDAALDRVLTTLALAQSSSFEHQTAFSVLSNEISSLGFPSSSPDETIQLISAQFRQARLELEYPSPGEVAVGFENEKLLGLLVERVKALTQKVKERDETVDQYHEQELLLRQQLNTRIVAMDHMKDQLKDQLKLANDVVGSLREEIKEKEVGRERLRAALEEYRGEVRGLEDLVERIEREGVLKEEAMRSEISELDNSLQNEVMRHEVTRADCERKDMVMVDLQRRLSAALAAAAEVKQEFDKLTSSSNAMAAEKDAMIAEKDTMLAEKESTIIPQETTITNLQTAATDREQAHGNALALRDARVTELRAEIDRINTSSTLR